LNRDVGDAERNNLTTAIMMVEFKGKSGPEGAFFTVEFDLGKSAVRVYAIQWTNAFNIWQDKVYLVTYML
jgi:hypothetical protein